MEKSVHPASGTRRARSARLRRWLTLATFAGVSVACDHDRGVTSLAEAPDFAVLATAHRQPEVFAPGVISDERWQWRLTFTPNGKTAYFSASDGFFPQTRDATIYVSHRGRDGSWSAPMAAPFSGVHSDIDPLVTPSGRRLYFASNRPAGETPQFDFDIWFVERTRDGWSEPIHAGPEVNSDLDELYASATAFGTLYVASGPFAPTPDANWDIYRANRRGRFFAAREPVDGVNTELPFDPNDPTADWEFNPEISRDGRTLIFTSMRPGGHGFGDLYVSCLRRGGWTEPLNLGPPVNTADDEFHPTLARNGRTLYFARTIFTPEFVPSDFYSIPSAALEVQPRRCRRR